MTIALSFVVGRQEELDCPPEESTGESVQTKDTADVSPGIGVDPGVGVDS